MQNKYEVKWTEFEKIEFRVGTILKVENFIKAKKPAYILYIDLAEEIGACKSSVQITDNYDL